MRDGPAPSDHDDRAAATDPTTRPYKKNWDGSKSERDRYTDKAASFIGEEAEEEGNDRSRYDEQAVMRPGGTRKRNKRFIPSDTSDAESEEEALSNDNIYKPYPEEASEVSEVSDVPDFMSDSSRAV